MYTLMRVKDFDAASDLPAVLLDRLWPRGVRKEHLQEVSWEKAATPSSALRVWFHEDREHRFDAFVQRLREELTQPDAQQALARIRLLEQQHGQVTLLTAARDPQHSHLVVIRDLLQS